MKRIFTYFLFLTVPLCFYGQTSDSLKHDLTGKWAMTKHIVLLNGDSTNVVSKFTPPIYYFYKDGTYYKTGRKKRFKEIGTWTLYSNDSILHLSNRVFSYGKKIDKLQDKDFKILKWTVDGFSFDEYEYEEFILGTSYYKKMKD